MSGDQYVTKVLVNAVAARRGGGAHHLGPFVVGLAEELPGAAIEVLVTSDAPALPSHPRVTWAFVAVPSGISLRRLWWDNVTVPLRTRHADVLISPLNFGPIWSPRPHLLFQRNALYFDRRYTRTLNVRQRVKLAGYRFLAVLQSNAATAVLVPSDAMGDLLGRYLLSRRKVIVSPHDVARGRWRELARADTVSRAQAWSVRGVRLLHVGSPSPHKGLPTLAATFVAVSQALPTTDVGLAVTFDQTDGSPPVKEFNDVVARAGLADRVTFLGTVGHDEVFPLYRLADVLLLPSEVESFGFPVIEALEVGCPVVCSDLPALREVGGGAELLQFHPVGDSEVAAGAVVVLLSYAPDEAVHHRAVRTDPARATSQCADVGEWVREHRRPRNRAWWRPWGRRRTR